MNITNTMAQPRQHENSRPVDRIKVHDGERELGFEGREADTLNRLIDRGERGLTSLENHGPRTSHYTMKLRKAGLVIETRKEQHGGGFRGWHGRYILRTPLHVIDRVRAGEVRHAA